MDCCRGARHAGEGNGHAGWDDHGVGIWKCGAHSGNRLSVVCDVGHALRHKQVDADLAAGCGVPVGSNAGQKNTFIQARVARQAYAAVSKLK